MDFYTIGTGATAILSAALGFFVYYRDRNALLNRKWLALSISISTWALGYFFTLTGWFGKSASLLCSRLSHASGAFIPILFFDFVIILLDEREKYVKLLRYGYIASFIIFILSLTPLVVKDLIPKLNIKYYPEWGILYFAYGALYYLFAAYGNIRLYRVMRHSTGYRRNQLKYFFIGTALGFLGGVSLFFLIFNLPIPPFASVLIGLYPIVTSYAIVRHHLMEIEIVIKKTLVFAGLLVSVFAILVVPTLLIQEYLVRNAAFNGRLIGLAVSSLIIIFLMRRMEDFLINITDKYLFQKRYNYKELLKTFTTEVLAVLNLDELVELTTNKLVNIIKLNSCAVLLFDEQTQRFGVMADYSIKDPSVTLVKPDDIVAFLEHTHGYLLLSELAGQKIFVPESIRAVMDKLNAELIVSMVLHSRVIGILSLGKKKSDEEYTQDDLDIILPLARTLAIAISNAKLFAELGKTQAEAAQREKMAVIGTLSAGINHEICNPLGIARGQCEAFLLNVKDGLYHDKSPQELLEKAESIMAKVMKEVDRATLITKKLSSFAKPTKGELELINIDRELDEVMGLVGHELRLEKIDVERRLDKDLPHVLVDRKQFQEVLFNLLRNASQAIGEKGSITISARSANGRVFMDIKDTGTGIPQDKIGELFNPFFTTKEPGKGTGLGLFIVRQIVEKNGGKIYLNHTRVGEGTTFTLEFPAAEPAMKGA